MSQQVYDKPDPSISKLWEAEYYPVGEGYDPYIVGTGSDGTVMIQGARPGELAQTIENWRPGCPQSRSRWRPIFASTEPFPPRPPEVKVELAERKVDGEPRVLVTIGGQTFAHRYDGLYMGQCSASMREHYTNIRPYSPSAS